MSYQPPPGATQNAQGFWVLPNGNFAPGQDAALAATQQQGATPQQTANQMGAPQVDASGKPFRMINGQTWYIPPSDGAGYTGAGGGGLIHGNQQWNPQTGQYDTPLDWGKILSMVAAGVVTAGVANVVLASTPALAATAPAGASVSAAAPTAAASTLGPTSAASMAATTAAGSTAPAGIASLAGPVASAIAPVAASAVGGTLGGVPYGSLINASVGLFGSLFGAKMQSDSAANALAAETAAQKYAADLQAKSTADALAFQKSTAENAFQNNEASRQGNYGQWAEAQKRLGSVGDLIGAPTRVIAPYVPGVDPKFDTSGGAAAPGSPTTAPGAPGDLTSMLTANYKSLGVAPTGRGTGPTDLAYYQDEINKTGGATPQNLAYWMGPTGRIASDLAKANGGGNAPAPTAPPVGSVGSYLGGSTPYAPVPMAAPLTMPGSPASYLGSY